MRIGGGSFHPEGVGVLSPGQGGFATPPWVSRAEDFQPEGLGEVVAVAALQAARPVATFTQGGVAEPPCWAEGCQSFGLENPDRSRRQERTREKARVPEGRLMIHAMFNPTRVLFDLG